MLERDEDILQAAEDWKKAGHGVAIATGKPLYTEDLTVPGTLVVKLLR